MSDKPELKRLCDRKAGTRQGGGPERIKAQHQNGKLTARECLIIESSETRPRLINALEMLQNKRDSNPSKKHGNIPL